MKLLKREPKHIQGKIFQRGVALKSVYRSGAQRPASIRFSEGQEAFGSCIRCPDTPCIEYIDSELSFAFFPGFGIDNNSHVCSTDAIRVDSGDGSPTIDGARCISCGLCVLRCPVFAIHLTPSGAHINDDENALFRLSGKPVSQDTVSNICEQLKGLKITGKLIDNPAEQIKHVYRRYFRLAGGLTSQSSNILVRNLMIALGINWKIRRIGDVNLRVDAVFNANNGNMGVAAVDLSTSGALDAPRNMLDGCAVLIARHGISKSVIIPVIVSSVLPNLRSEYWRVIKDIKATLGLRISSISLGILLYALWEGKNIPAQQLAAFYADVDEPTLAPTAQHVIGERAASLQDIKGVVAPLK